MLLSLPLPQRLSLSLSALQLALCVLHWRQIALFCWRTCVCLSVCCYDIDVLTIASTNTQAQTTNTTKIIIIASLAWDGKVWPLAILPILCPFNRLMSWAAYPLQILCAALYFGSSTTWVPKAPVAKVIGSLLVVFVCCNKQAKPKTKVIIIMRRRRRRGGVQSRAIN